MTRDKIHGVPTIQVPNLGIPKVVEKFTLAVCTFKAVHNGYICQTEELSERRQKSMVHIFTEKKDLLDYVSKQVEKLEIIKDQ